jgi:D-alanyl-D-alanine carboxypeptidase (penicillin-binding protein 5/6)
MYRTYNARPIPQPTKPRRQRSGLVFALVIVLIAAVYSGYALVRPLPAPKVTILPPVVPAQVKVDIPWPASGQTAFGADGYGQLANHKEQKPSPTASVTKVITALSILEKKPLRPGETGPAIPLTAKDVELYNQYVAKDGAAVPVAAGETITEYQALQAMMLPSANNIADTTAIWAFGSLDAYKAHANSLVKRLGMTQTTVDDASGFSPKTVSTASDLVRLGDAALDHPVLAEIVAQKQAVFPGYGTINNVNTLIGQAGIRGIKTGNTDEAGGCYLAAADVQINGKKVTVITAIMGSTSRPQAMRDSLPIIQSAVSQFQNVAVVKTDQKVGYVTTPWGGNSDIVAASDIAVLSWTGTALAPKVHAAKIRATSPAGTKAGDLTLSYTGKDYVSPLTTSTTITKPSITWRLTHPF